MINNITNNLINEALKAQKNAICPYSNYPVGAAILTDDNKIISGFNIESKAYPTTLCAERVAIFSALAQGYNKFKSLAVVTIDGAMPCGSCRQIMHEYAGNISIYIAKDLENYIIHTISDLLPFPFG